MGHDVGAYVVDLSKCGEASFAARQVACTIRIARWRAPATQAPHNVELMVLSLEVTPRRTNLGPHSRSLLVDQNNSHRKKEDAA